MTRSLMFSPDERPKYKQKLYQESIETLNWLTKNVEKQKESLFIRTAVSKEIKRKQRVIPN